MQALLKDLKVANTTVQVEKEIYFQHLMGLGANMVQISDTKRVYRQNKPDNHAHTFVNVEKYV